MIFTISCESRPGENCSLPFNKLGKKSSGKVKVAETHSAGNCARGIHVVLWHARQLFFPLH